MKKEKQRRVRHHRHVDDGLSKSRWQRILETQDAFQLQKEHQLHHAYCRDDPMYQLIHGPHEILEFRDPDTRQVVRRVTFIDRILQMAWNIVRKRLPEMEQMPMVKRIAERISSPDLHDAELKLFVLCFLIHWFPHVREFFQSLYPNDTPRAKRQRAHFDALIPHLEQWCTGVTHSRYNVSTVDHIMHLFLYRDLLPSYATGALPVGTPIYDDEMRAHLKQLRDIREEQKKHKEMIRLRKASMMRTY